MQIHIAHNNTLLKDMSLEVKTLPKSGIMPFVTAEENKEKRLGKKKCPPEKGKKIPKTD